MRTLFFLSLCVASSFAQSGKLGLFTNSGDVGNPVRKGSVAYDAASSQYRITGGGANMWAKEDQFQYVWREMNGNATVTATLEFLGQGVEHRKAGIVLRQNLETDSPYVDFVIHGNGMPGLQWRNTKGDITNAVDFPYDGPAKYKIKLQRQGSNVTVWLARNGAELKELGHTQVPLANPILVGLAVCSHNAETTDTVVFSDVAVEQPAKPDAKFELASIKSCKSDVGGGGGKRGSTGRIRSDPQRLLEECQSLETLIRDAFLTYPEGKAWTGASGPREVQGIPGWADAARYTIDAKAENPSTPEMMRGPMMQSLLEQRFHVTTHRETRDVPVYALTVAAGGPSLHPSHDGSCINFSEVLKLTNGAPSKYRGLPLCDGWNSRDGRTTFADMTITKFCQFLSSNMDRDVIDRTGIPGRFDLQIDAGRVYLPAADSGPRDDGMPFMPETDYAATAKAFQSALPKIGLKLESARGPGLFLVVDHVEKPSEN